MKLINDTLFQCKQFHFIEGFSEQKQLLHDSEETEKDALHKCLQKFYLSARK